MFGQIAIGSALIIVSVIVQVLFIEFALVGIKRIYRKPDAHYPGFGAFVVILSGMTFWLLLAISIIVWIWAIVLIQLGVFAAWEESLYFSLVAFTTLGFGDVILPQHWRLLSGFIAANGFVLFGLNTAVLIELMMRLRNPD